MEKLHLGARWLFRLRVYRTFIFIAIWVIFMSIGFISKFRSNFGGFLSAFIVSSLNCILVIVIIGEIYARLSYRFWGYEFTKNEMKIEKGIIWKTYKSIPYGRIQNIDIKRGIVARILGFSTLEIQTAGYSAIQTSGRSYGTHSEGYLPAVATEEAEKIRNFLIKRIGNKKQGL